MTVIDEALKHPQVEALYKQVDAKTPITIEITDDLYWSSSTIDGKTKIKAGKAAHPASALMHELQHADTKADGFQQYIVSMTVSKRGLLVMDVLSALDNELQHHRMFPQFVAAGLDPKTFYSDDDEKTFGRVRRQLRRMTPSDDIVDFFLKFLSVMAPGGHGTDEERRKLRVFLFQCCGDSKRKKLEEIEHDIKEWSSAPMQDHSQLLKSILVKLNITEVWIANKTSFPDSGFFVGEAFSYSLAESFMQKMGLLS